MFALVSLAAEGKTQREIAAEVGCGIASVNRTVGPNQNSSERAQPIPQAEPAESEGTAIEAPDLDAIREKAYAEAYEEARLGYRARVLDLITRAQAVGCPVAVAHAAIRQDLNPDQAQAIVDAAGVASGRPPNPGRTH